MRLTRREKSSPLQELRSLSHHGVFGLGAFSDDSSPGLLGWCRQPVEAPNPDPVQLSHQAFPTRSRRTQSAPPSLRSTTQQPNGVSRTPGPVILRDARVLPALCLESSISHSWFRVGATQNPWWYGSILKPHRKKSVGGDPWKPWWYGPISKPSGAGA